MTCFRTARSLISRNMSAAPPALTLMAFSLLGRFAAKSRKRGGFSIKRVSWKLRLGYWQPCVSSSYRRSRASRLPLSAAAFIRTLAWSQFLLTPAPRANRSASETSAETEPAWTAPQSASTLSVSLQFGSGFWVAAVLCRSSAEVERSETLEALGEPVGLAASACDFGVESFAVSSAAFFDSATGSESGIVLLEFLSAAVAGAASGVVVGSAADELSDGATVDAFVFPLIVSPIQISELPTS